MASDSRRLVDTVIVMIVPPPPEESLDTVLRTRFLQGNGSKLQLSTAAAIAWYCCLVTIVVPILTCALYCWYQKFQSQRRATMALQREHQLEEMSRIEANIQMFSEVEKSKRVRIIRSAIKDQVKKITKADLKTKRVKRNEEDEDEGNNNSCSICLDDFKVDESVAQSSNSVCHHLFHEECIILWLSARRDAFCPYCRRPFLCLPINTSQTSIASHDPISTTLDDLESSRTESSVIAVMDERAITDALDVVEEDLDNPSGDDEETVATAF